MIARQKRATPILIVTGMLAVLLVVPLGPASAEPGDTSRVSVSSDEVEGNGASGFGQFTDFGRAPAPAVSGDGNLVAFSSAASNLVAGDTNEAIDVFVRDRQTGITTRVSVDSGGGQGDGDSFNPAISADGRYVAFESRAPNLVEGDTNGFRDLFVQDRQTGTTERLYEETSGASESNFDLDPAISADGRYVAFSSFATSLVPGDTTNFDVFIHDRETGAVELVSVDSSGAKGNNNSFSPAISADGQVVAFLSGASNLVAGDTNGASGADAFVHDRQSGVTTRVNVDSTGSQANDSVDQTPALSADGRYVAFVSPASNLVPGDTNGFSDVFVHDRTTGVTSRASVDSTGNEANGVSSDFPPALSADGRYVAFQSRASNLVPGDTNLLNDVFLHDRDTGATTLVSVDSAGNQANSASFGVALSADAVTVAFASRATNLIPDDTNSVDDVFVHEVGPPSDGGPETPTVTLTDPIDVSNQTAVTVSGTGEPGTTADISVDDDNPDTPPVTTTVAVGESGAYSAVLDVSGLDDGTITATVTLVDEGGTTSAPGTDTATKSTSPPVDAPTTRVSVSSDEVQGDGFSFEPSISAGGRFVAFDSRAPNLVPGDANGASDVFVRDRQEGTTTRVSVDSAGGEVNGSSYQPSISDDGRLVAFTSSAPDLVPGDTNAIDDVFVHDRQTGETSRVDVDSDGGQASGGAYQPSISGDGRVVAFTSSSSDLVPGDTNGQPDVFVHDRETGTTSRVSVDSLATQANGASLFPRLSFDGGFVAFLSGATNLVPGDTNQNSDVFVHDRQTGATTRVSVSSAGAQADQASGPPAVSGDDRFVVFESGASNLVVGDTNSMDDFFLHDRNDGSTIRVSAQGGESESLFSVPGISGDGSVVVFESGGAQVAEDTNARRDVFAYDRATGTITLASVGSNGEQGNANSGAAAVSSDGNVVAFSSVASNLVPDDTNGASDVFVHQLEPFSPGPGAPTVTLTDPIDASNQTAVTVSGTGEPGTTADISVDDDNPDTPPVTTTVAVDEGGVYVAVLDVSGLDDGTLTATVTLTDEGGSTSPPGTATATKTTAPIENQPPVAAADAATTDVDTPVAVDVLSNDIDPDGDPLTVTANSEPANGTVSCEGSGTCTYTPDAGFTGADSFTYTVDDGQGGSDAATVSLNVLAGGGDSCVRTLSNGDPNTTEGAVSVTVDGLGAFGSASPFGGDAFFNPMGPVQTSGTIFSSNLFVGGLGFLASSCGDGQDVSLVEESPTSLVSRATLGGLVFEITQTLGPVEEGSTLVQTYRIINPGGATSLALVRHVDGDLLFDGTLSDGGAATPNGEVLYEFDSSDDPNTPSTFVGISGDLNGDSIPQRWTLQPFDYRGAIVAAGGIPEGDDAQVAGDTDGDLIVDQPYDVTVSQQWDAELLNGDAVELTTVTRFGQQAPNQPPDAIDDTVTTDVETPVAVDVLANDTDPDGDALTLTANTEPANGTVSCEAGGTCTYTPDAGFSGADSFTYTVDDGRGGTDSATVTVNTLSPTTTTSTSTTSTTSTSLPPTTTTTSTSLPPTTTSTSTSLPPTSTSTSLPPTSTSTSLPPTTTSTSTSLPPTTTSTSTTTTATTTTTTPPSTTTTTPSTTTGTTAPPTQPPTTADPTPTPDPANPTGPGATDSSGSGSSDTGTASGGGSATTTPDVRSVPIPTPPVSVEDVLSLLPTEDAATEGPGLILDRPSAVSGGQAVAQGRGCEPGSEVVVRISDALVGTTRADDEGAFQVELSLPDLSVGRHEVVARCGTITSRSPLDIVVVTASNGGASGTVGVVLCFFVLLGLLVFHAPNERERMVGRP